MGGTSLFGWMEPNHFDREAANFFMERAKNNVGLMGKGIEIIFPLNAKQELCNHVSATL